MGAGMRHVVGFGDWSTGGGIFSLSFFGGGGANRANCRAHQCNQWGVSGVTVIVVCIVIV